VETLDTASTEAVYAGLASNLILCTQLKDVSLVLWLLQNNKKSTMQIQQWPLAFSLALPLQLPLQDGACGGGTDQVAGKESGCRDGRF